MLYRCNRAGGGRRYAPLDALDLCSCVSQVDTPLAPPILILRVRPGATSGGRTDSDMHHPTPFGNYLRMQLRNIKIWGCRGVERWLLILLWMLETSGGAYHCPSPVESNGVGVERHRVDEKDATSTKRPKSKNTLMLCKLQTRGRGWGRRVDARGFSVVPLVLRIQCVIALLT